MLLLLKFINQYDRCKYDNPDGNQAERYAYPEKKTA